MKWPIRTAEVNTNVPRSTLQLGCLNRRHFLTSSIINVLIKDNQYKMNFVLILWCCPSYKAVRNMQFELVGCSGKSDQTLDKEAKRAL